MDSSKDNFKKCFPNKSHCSSHMLRTSRMTLSNIKNISWWDNQIKQEMKSMKTTDLTFKELVLKRRQEKRSYQQSMSSLLLRISSSKSMHRMSHYTGLYPNDLGGTVRKFLTLPKNNARIWRRSHRTYTVNPVDTYDKMEKEMKSNFLEFYNANMEDTNKIDELLKKLFSTEVDPLSLSSAVKVVPQFCNVLPDLTVKHLGKLKLRKSEMVTRMIHRDLKSLKKKKPTVAFGKTLGQPRSKASKYDFKTKCANTEDPYKKLETFQNVWEDILDLETTKLFSAWLMRHDHIEPPGYLIKEGGLRRRQKSIDKSDELLWKNLEGFNTEFPEPVEFYDLLSKHLSQFSKSSLDTISSSTSLHSLDISDINIII